MRPQISSARYWQPPDGWSEGDPHPDGDLPSERDPPLLADGKPDFSQSLQELQAEELRRTLQETPSTLQETPRWLRHGGPRPPRPRSEWCLMLGKAACQ